MRILGIIASSLLKKITDAFNRTTSGSLGTSDTGNTWAATRGTWYANGTQAKSDDAASGYPIASVGFNQDTTIKADTTGGVGVAFWVTDSGSWWASYPFYSSSTSSTSNCDSGYGSFSSPSPCCGGYSQSTQYSCRGSDSLSGSTCTSAGYSFNYVTVWGSESAAASHCASDGGSYSSPMCYFAGSSYPADATVVYSCYTSYSTTSTTTYSNSIRIISSVSGSVAVDSTTALTNSTSGYTSINSIEVNTLGNTITAKGYATAGQVSQLGSTVTRTVTSPTRGSSVGIIKAPTDANQGSTLDNFSAV